MSDSNMPRTLADS